MSDKKILIAEDSPTMRRIIHNSLRTIGFQDVTEAENGQDAWQKLQDKQVDLVITDWNMPEMNGAQLVGKLRSSDQYKKTPIIMITTRGMKEDVFTAIKLGVNGYIVKPFSPDDLKTRIREVMS
ncbi:MAG: response regulator [Fidelibacterota bacterium]